LEDNSLEHYGEGVLKKIKDNECAFEICISKTQWKNRKKFTIAHEIGHLILHFYYFTPEIWNQLPDGEDILLAARNGRFNLNYNEHEADEFAGALLMPKSQFIEKFNELNKDRGKLSNFFQVATSAIYIRSKNLGLLR